MLSAQFIKPSKWKNIWVCTINPEPETPIVNAAQAINLMYLQFGRLADLEFVQSIGLIIGNRLYDLGWDIIRLGLEFNTKAKSPESDTQILLNDIIDPIQIKGYPIKLTIETKKVNGVNIGIKSRFSKSISLGYYLSPYKGIDQQMIRSCKLINKLDYLHSMSCPTNIHEIWIQTNRLDLTLMDFSIRFAVDALEREPPIPLSVSDPIDKWFRLKFPEIKTTNGNFEIISPSRKFFIADIERIWFIGSEYICPY